MRKTAHLLSCSRTFSASSNVPSQMLTSRINIGPRVRQALAHGEPVVALESTIVAHGMPFPQNLELAQEVESILLDKGVTPATIAVKDGIFQVGLSSEDLSDLAKAGSEGRASKCSTRELSLLLGKSSLGVKKGEGHQWGATTVASTMALAHRVGIATFVTGGIGGVHRNGHISMDISADLTELSRTGVVVVCAGIKSILDIGRTLEVLETLGVPTVSYGTTEFPAFFSPHSGVHSPSQMDDCREIAEAYWAARDLEMPHGMLVAVPNKDPAGTNVETAIQAALENAESQGIKGWALTPFILKEVAHKTGGDSLRSNMALVRNNARVGADIAIAIASRNAASTFTYSPPTPSSPPSRVLTLGGTVMDIVASPNQGKELLMGTSNPGIIIETDGGVARNVSEALGRLGSNPLFYSAVGNDSRGLTLMNRLQDECGVQHDISIVDEANTATYLAVLNSRGDMHTAIADMSVLSQVKPPTVDAMRGAEILITDANPPLTVLKEAFLLAREHDVKVAFEPTSVPKAQKVVKDPELLSCLTYAFPNLDELTALADLLPDKTEDTDKSSSDPMSHIRAACLKVLSSMNKSEALLVVTMGDQGVLVASRGSNDEKPTFHKFPAKHVVTVKNATGAGDSLCGAFVHAILEGNTVEEAVKFGMEAAVLSLQCAEQAISPKLSELSKK